MLRQTNRNYNQYFQSYTFTTAVAGMAVARASAPNLRWSWSTESGLARFGAALAYRVPHTARQRAQPQGEPQVSVIVLGVGFASDDIECASDKAIGWIKAHVEASPLGLGTSSFPDPLAYKQRYGTAHPNTTFLLQGSAVPPAIQLRCDFHSAAGQVLRLRGRTWRVDGIRIDPHGFPFTPPSDAQRTPARSKASSSMNPQHQQVTPTTVLPQTLPEALPSLVRTTVCMPYAWGVSGAGGPSAARIVAWVSWYLLLGAHRIVIFDDFDQGAAGPPQTASAETAGAELIEAEARQHVLHALPHVLRERFVRVRGLCVHDTYLRASPHQHCQVLANNICRHAARAADSAGAYVFTPDIDEFLCPPLPLPERMTESTHAAAEGAMPLRGALVSLASRLHAQHTASTQQAAQRSALHDELVPPESTRRGPRIEHKAGHGACLKFADVRYVQPRCMRPADANHIVHLGHGDGAAVLRFSLRATPHNFERGPSTRWRSLRKWGTEVRAKFLTSASPFDSDHIAIHHCCLPLHGVPPDRACRFVEHMPLEQWHIRHVRLAHDTLPCRVGPLAAARDRTPGYSGRGGAAAGNKRTDGIDVVLREEELVNATLPASWADEYKQTVRWLRDRLVRVAES